MTPNRSRRRSTALRLLAPVVALGLVAAACGDDDDDSSDTTATASDTTAAASDTTAASSDTTAAPATTGAPTDGPTIRLRGQDFSESVTIAEVYGQFLQANGYDVEIQTPAGFRQEAIASLENGDLDLIVDYIGGSAAALAPDAPPSSDADEIIAIIAPAYEEIGATVLQYSPAIDGDAFVVRGDAGITTISEVPQGEYVFGASAQCFERPQCFIGLTDPDEYGLEFADTVTLEFGPLLGEALAAEEVDAVIWNDTAPQITENGFIVLEDDLGLFPAQNIAPIITTTVLEAYGDQLSTLLDELSAAITTEDLLAWNTETDIEFRESDAVATEWLESKGLL
ncbi:MAG: glycine betaine ABC transporter substrate-binding protein [Actinomycetota bacterium]